MERFGQVEARAAQRRSEPREDGREQRRQRCESNRTCVDGDVVESRKVTRGNRRSEPHERPREREPETAAECRQDSTFSQQLTRQARTARPDGRTHRQLALARDAARQKEIRHVRAGDQQDTGDAGRQHEKGRTDARRHFLEQAANVDHRRTADAEQQVRRHRTNGRSRGRRPFGFGLRRCYARTKAPQRVHDGHASATSGHRVRRRFLHVQWRPQKGIARWKRKSRPRHADDGVRLAVNRNAAANHIRIGVESFAPAAIAENAHGIAPAPRFTRLEEPPARGGRAEQGEHGGRHRRSFDSRRPVGEPDGVLVGPVCGELLDGPRRADPGVIREVAQHRFPER